MHACGAETFRARGVPSHLLGTGHFDDHSSDNSIGADEKLQHRNSSPNMQAHSQHDTTTANTTTNEIDDIEKIASGPVQNSLISSFPTRSGAPDIDEKPLDAYFLPVRCDDIRTDCDKDDRNGASGIVALRPPSTAPASLPSHLMHDVDIQKLTDTTGSCMISAVRPFVDAPLSVREEFAPPPGAPKPENSARLRRYRLNLE